MASVQRMLCMSVVCCLNAVEGMALYIIINNSQICIYIYTKILHINSNAYKSFFLSKDYVYILKHAQTHVRRVSNCRSGHRYCQISVC